MLTFVRIHEIDERRMAVEYFEDWERPRDCRRMIRLVAFADEKERQAKLRAVDREWSC